MLRDLLALAGVVVLTGLSSVLVAAELALVTANRAEVAARARAGSRRARGLERALGALTTELGGVQVGITASNLVVGALAEPALARVLGRGARAAGLELGGGPAAVVALVLVTALTMVLGELVPKGVALADPLGVGELVQGPLRWWTALVRGPVWVCNASASALLALVGVEARSELASARAADELGALVRHSAEEGALAAETADLVERSLAFGERRARDVMTPWAMVVGLERSASASSVLEAAARTGHSRFPVVDDEGDVVGVVTLRAVLGVRHEERRAVRVGDVMGAAAVVPDTVPLDTLLDALRGSGPSGGLQMAVVVDEFGSTVGLVTLEDLVEELVGAVRDEHDEGEAEASLNDDGSWVLPGSWRPDEASAVLGVGVPAHEDYDTLGGLVVLHLERLAEVGDTVVVAAEVEPGRRPRDLRLRVEAVVERRVEAVTVRVVRTVDAPDALEDGTGDDAPRDEAARGGTPGDGTPGGGA